MPTSAQRTVHLPGADVDIGPYESAIIPKIIHKITPEVNPGVKMF